MSEEHQALFAAALALPEAVRVVLAEQLLESLPPESEADEETVDAAWLDELRRRRQEFERGEASPLPWSVVREQS